MCKMQNKKNENNPMSGNLPCGYVRARKFATSAEDLRNSRKQRVHCILLDRKNPKGIRLQTEESRSRLPTYYGQEGLNTCKNISFKRYTFCSILHGLRASGDKKFAKASIQRNHHVQRPVISRAMNLRLEETETVTPPSRKMAGSRPSCRPVKGPQYGAHSRAETFNIWRADLAHSPPRSA